MIYGKKIRQAKLWHLYVKEEKLFNELLRYTQVLMYVHNYRLIHCIDRRQVTYSIGARYCLVVHSTVISVHSL